MLAILCLVTPADGAWGDQSVQMTPRQGVLTDSLRRRLYDGLGRKSECVIVGTWEFLKNYTPFQVGGHATVPSSSPSKPIAPKRDTPCRRNPGFQRTRPLWARPSEESTCRIGQPCPCSCAESAAATAALRLPLSLWPPLSLRLPLSLVGF